MTGAHQAFLDVTLPHLDAVSNVARRLIGSASDADDLVQETFLRAFAAFGGFRGEDPRAWLMSICLNAFRSQLRRHARRPREQAWVDVSPVAEVDVAAEAIATVDREAIRRALGELPEPQRIAIVLMDVAGLTAQQTADLVGAPRGTVLARVHRGRRRLASLLADQQVRDDV